MKISFQIEGGVGKNVLATAVVRAISKKYPDHKIIIVTAHRDVWQCNPNVWRIIEFGKTEYFYQDHVEGQDIRIFSQDPYRHEDYILNKRHLIDIWCDICGVEPDGHNPELFFTKLENDFLLNSLDKDYRPIFVINAFGGAETQQHKYSWMRDIPPQIAQEVVDHFSKTHRVIQVRRPDQIELSGAESISRNVRELSLLLLHSDKRLLIDSFLQHSSAALGLSSTVLWIGNSPNVLGYELHTNIVTENLQPGDVYQSFYEKFDILGNPIQLAGNPNDLFDAQTIIDSFN